jgi:hypothetical protein
MKRTFEDSGFASSGYDAEPYDGPEPPEDMYEQQEHHVDAQEENYALDLETEGARVLSIGKHKGKTFRELFDSPADAAYISWIVSQPLMSHPDMVRLCRWRCSRFCFALLACLLGTWLF